MKSMSRIGMAALVACGAISYASGAHAQGYTASSVTLYGVLSTGVAYVSNEGGHSAVKMVPGTMQNNRWGLRGTEDLGGGVRGVFLLENGFAIDDGKFQQGGRMFGRQAYVGLGSDTLGTLTLGRQYDAIYDTLDVMSAPVAANGLAAHIGDNDNVFGSFRHNNAVKYVSPNWGGLRAQASYALADSNSSSNNRSFSVGGTYDGGPLRLAAAFMQLDRPGLANGNPGGAVTDDYAGAPFVLYHTSPTNPSAGVTRQRTGGFAAGYGNDKWRANAMLTQSRYDYQDGTGLRLTNYDINATYSLTPALVLGAAYVFTDGNYRGLDRSPKWHMGQLSLDYFLSKRTDVYVYGVYQKASSSQADIYLFAPSSGDTQTIVVAGIRHKF